MGGWVRGDEGKCIVLSIERRTNATHQSDANATYHAAAHERHHGVVGDVEVRPVLVLRRLHVVLQHRQAVVERHPEDHHQVRQKQQRRPRVLVLGRLPALRRRLLRALHAPRRIRVRAARHGRCTRPDAHGCGRRPVGVGGVGRAAEAAALPEGAELARRPRRVGVEEVDWRLGAAVPLIGCVCLGMFICTYERHYHRIN